MSPKPTGYILIEKNAVTLKGVGANIIMVFAVSALMGWLLFMWVNGWSPWNTFMNGFIFAFNIGGLVVNFAVVVTNTEDKYREVFIFKDEVYEMRGKRK